MCYNSYDLLLLKMTKHHSFKTFKFKVFYTYTQQQFHAQNIICLLNVSHYILIEKPTIL